MPRQHWLDFGGRQQQSAHNTSSGVIKKSENKSKQKQYKAKAKAIATTAIQHIYQAPERGERLSRALSTDRSDEISEKKQTKKK
jgi:hypothetical protein